MVLVWKQNNILQIFTHYKKLLNILASDLQLTAGILESVESDTDILIRVLVSTLSSSNKILPLLRILIFNEINKAGACEGSILRGNSVTTKLETAFTQLIGQEYIKVVFTDIVSTIMKNQDFDFEINPLYISEKNPTKQKAIIDERRRQLESVTYSVLTKISDPSIIAKAPREIRAICGYTLSAAQSAGQSNPTHLIGGYLILRVFSPALVSPESYGLCKEGIQIGKKSRRNLVLLAKVLQILSNGVITEKEPFMSVISDFFNEHVNTMAQYLNTMATDPLHTQRGLKPWGDLESSNATVIDIEKNTNINTFDLFELHRIVYQCMPKLREKFKANESPTNANSSNWVRSEVKTKRNFFTLIAEMGPPPSQTSLSSFDGSEATISNSNSRQTRNTVQVFESSQFFYQGLNSNANQLVFYVIVSRFPTDLLRDTKSLVEYVCSVMGRQIVEENRYLLVIDLSWSKISNDVKLFLYTFIQEIHKMLARPYKKNVEKIYIVHPNSFTKKLLSVVKNFTSEKVARKIVEIYNWKELTKVIKESAILLPESSKAFITKSFSVTKINAKGKRQNRLIKFTLDSFLNIDSNSHSIKNETLIIDIAEIEADQNKNLLTLRFTPEKVQKSTVKLKFLENSEDKMKRVYEFASIEERDRMICEIFIAGINRFRGISCQEFQVIKINKRGKKQERVQKLTVDSLMNLSGKQIQKETPLGTIEYVILDTSSPDLVCLKSMNESQSRRLVFPKHDASLFVQSIKERILVISKEEKDYMEKETLFIAKQAQIVGDSLLTESSPHYSPSPVIASQSSSFLERKSKSSSTDVSPIVPLASRLELNSFQLPPNANPQLGTQRSSVWSVSRPSEFSQKSLTTNVSKSPQPNKTENIDLPQSRSTPICSNTQSSVEISRKRI